MNRFIRIRRTSGEKVLIGLAHVVAVEEDADGKALIRMSGGQEYQTNTDIDKAMTSFRAIRKEEEGC